MLVQELLERMITFEPFNLHDRIKGRERYRRMMTEQGAEKRRQQQIILLQCCIRMQLAIRRRRMLKAKRRDNAQIQLASAMKSYI